MGLKIKQDNASFNKAESMEILVQNKQRSYKIDLLKVETMCHKLAKALIDNLKHSKPKAEWAADLSIIDQASLSLIIVSPTTIRQLNKQWLNKDKETDVLSFPLLDFASRKVCTELNTPLDLGEIFICYKQAIEQAKEYNHSLERELAFLFVHGLLHLLGFDHQNQKDEKEMFNRQKQILNSANYTR
jgi:probable rRNA maturation factor